jgi:hypothetical protein
VTAPLVAGDLDGFFLYAIGGRDGAGAALAS